MDTQSRIRVTILGGGKGGSVVLDLLMHLPHVHIVGIADTNPLAPALQKAKQLHIPVSIICDIRMPKINGVEAIQYFQTQFPRVPLIVMTGHPDVQMATSFLNGGVVDYLVKPVESEKLIATVAKAVDSKDNSFF